MANKSTVFTNDVKFRGGAVDFTEASEVTGIIEKDAVIDSTTATSTNVPTTKAVKEYVDNTALDIETDIANIQSDIEISAETIEAFKAIGWTPPSE